MDDIPCVSGGAPVLVDETRALQILDMGRSAFYSRIAKGLIKQVRFSSRLIKYDVADLKAFIEKSKQTRVQQ